MSRRLLWSYLTLTAFVLLILEVPMAIYFARSEKDQLVFALQRDAFTLASAAEDLLQHKADGPPDAQLAAERDRLRHIVEGYQSKYQARVLIVDKAGMSQVDSENPDRFNVDYARSQPEIQKVLDLDHPLNPRPGPVSLTRHSSTLDIDELFVAVPVRSGNTLYGAVRMSYPVTKLDALVHRIWLSLAFLAFVVMAAATIVGALLARSVTRPIRSLERAVGAFAGGDLSVTAPTDDGPVEIRRLAAGFNEMARRLAQLIGAQRAFVADASHELRTPLAALRLRIENLEFASEDAIRGEVGQLSAEIKRLSRLVDGLLALARADGRRPERELVDIDTEVRQRVEAWQALAEEQDVRITYTGNGAVRATVVKGALPQILDNYLANALEVSPAGETISVQLERRGATIAIHVRDRGPGLGEADRQRVFDRFWRAPDAAPGSGSGLGLAIVRQLAEASGGGAALDPNPEGGIDAVVTLPLES